MFKPTLRAAALAFTLALGFTGLSNSALAADTYAVDKKGQHAFINFKVSHLGFSHIYGRFNDFDGSFVIDEDNPANSTVSITIQTESLDTNHAARDKHLRDSDFVDAAKFPTATFQSTGITVTGDKTAEVTGDFTFKGITKPLTLTVTQIGKGKDPWGGFRQGFDAVGSFNTEGYDMMPAVAASAEVELFMSIEGIKQ